MQGKWFIAVELLCTFHSFPNKCGMNWWQSDERVRLHKYFNNRVNNMGFQLSFEEGTKWNFFAEKNTHQYRMIWAQEPLINRLLRERRRIYVEHYIEQNVSFSLFIWKTSSFDWNFLHFLHFTVIKSMFFEQPHFIFGQSTLSSSRWWKTPKETSNNLKWKRFPQRCSENTNTHWRAHNEAQSLTT